MQFLGLISPNPCGESSSPVLQEDNEEPKVRKNFMMFHEKAIRSPKVKILKHSCRISRQKGISLGGKPRRQDRRSNNGLGNQSKNIGRVDYPKLFNIID
jgi:hypothetical protein